MTRFEALLDNIHSLAVGVERATKRRRRVRREHLIGALHALSAVTGAVSSFVPQARPFAAGAAILQQAAPNILPPEEQSMCTRLQSIHAQLGQAQSDEERVRLTAQAQLLLDMVEDKERQR